jgi:Protein of unknown function (DUF1488)
MEASFFICTDALKGLAPEMAYDEPSFLAIFDSHRKLILAAAAKAYSRGPEGSY